MKIAIQSPGIRKSRKFTQFLLFKFGHMEKLYLQAQRCDIILKKDHDPAEPFVVEALLTVPGNDLFAMHRGASFEAAVDRVTAALERQIEKRKSKLPSQRDAPPIDLVMGVWSEEGENS